MSQYTDNLARALEQARELQRICDKRFGTGRAELGALIRSNALSIVYSGRFRGQPAVFKLNRSVEGGSPLHGLRELLERYEVALEGEPFHVNPFLGAVPWKGLVILGQVPGTPLDEVLAGDDPARHDQATRALCGWLQAVSALGDQVDRFNPGHGLSLLRDLDLSRLPADEAQLIAEITQALERFGAAIKGQPMRRAVGHPDCHAGNFALEDDGALWAFDLQVVKPLPTARMVARYMAMKALRHGAGRRFAAGAVAGDLELVLDALPLAPGEGDAVLRFFLGVETVCRHVMLNRRSGQPDARRACLESVLTGLPREETR